MTIESINEPGKTRLITLTPNSINEPLIPPEGGFEAPSISSLDPPEITIGSPDTTLEVHGTGFYPFSVIHFAGYDEPTTFDAEAGTLSTGLNMLVWQGPDTVKVSVRNGETVSNEVDFTFLAEGAVRTSAKQDENDRKSHIADPDELEDEIEEAEEEGEFVSLHKPRGRR